MSAASFLKDEPQVQLEDNEPFKYNCDDLKRHQFYQALYSGAIVKIDEEWYNTYLDMLVPSNWLCTVKWLEKDGSIGENQIDFIITIDSDKIAFWFDETFEQFYCRKLINYILSV